MRDIYAWRSIEEIEDELNYYWSKRESKMEEHFETRTKIAEARAEGAMNALAQFARNVVLPWPEIKLGS